MMNKTRDLLVISYHLPPSLEPQSILVGRLLDHLPPSCRLHVVTADDSGARKDPSLYAGLRQKLANEIRVPYRGTMGWMLFRKILYPFFRCPDERTLWHVRAYRAVHRK